MIDTSKYEGHTEGSWEVFDYEGMSDEPSVKLKPDECWGLKETSLRPVTLEWVEDENGIDGKRQDVRINDPPLLYADAQLIADAPLLLEEVKRLREQISSVIRCMLAESEESPSWGATVHAYIKDLQKVIE